MFHVRHLHLGHLAKAFSLREAPSAVTNGGSKSKASKNRKSTDQKALPSDKAKRRVKERRDDGEDRSNDDDVKDAERRMEQVVRAQGRLTKKAGKMVSSGAGEFQIAGGDTLEKLVNTRS